MESTSFNFGNVVLCDFCNGDYTKSDESGGFLFGSKAVCPRCADDFMKKVRKYKEENYIKGKCPENKSFADWINEDIRNGRGCTVSIFSF